MNKHNIADGVWEGITWSDCRDCFPLLNCYEKWCTVPNDFLWRLASVSLKSEDFVVNQVNRMTQYGRIHAHTLLWGGPFPITSA